MSQQDDYRFNLVGEKSNPFLGYVSSVDRTNVAPGVIVRGSKNVYKKLSGTIAVRPGQKRRGEADATIAGIKTAFIWNTSLATVRPMRTVDGKLQVESSIADGSTLVWYDLITGLTETQVSAFVYDTWWNNSLKKDVLLFVYGTDNLQMWQGGIGKISSTTVNTIVLTATVASQGFDTGSGSVVINGTTYAYTGSSGSTLTGVTPDPSGEANGSVVLSAVVTTTNSPAQDFLNDFIKVINNQLYVGSYTSRLIYISADDDYTDFTTVTPPIAGSPDLLTLDSLGKGIGVKDGAAHIFGGTQDLYIVTFQNITVGTDLTRQTNVDKKTLAGLEAALGHNFITNVGDDLVWLSQDHDLKFYGTFRNLSTPVFPTLSLPVRDELQQENFTGGAISAIGQIIYITAPTNGAVWLHNTRVSVSPEGNVFADRFWHAPFIWNLSRIVEIDGVVYGASNANPQFYQLWDTEQWYDDSPSGDPLPYTCIAAFPYLQLKDRALLLNGNMAYYEGYMAQGSIVEAAVVLDYKGASGIYPTVLNSPMSSATFFTGNIGASLGDSSLGDNPLGDGISDILESQENLPKFRVIQTVTPTDAFESQLRVFSTVANSRWEILCLGTNFNESNSYPVFISKS